MLLVKETEIPGAEPVMKRSKYEDGICPKKFSNNGVKKLQIVGLLPKVQESYDNLSLMLQELDLSGVDETLCADIKLILTFEGKQSASSKHNCYICKGVSPWIEEADLMTIGDLQTNYEEYIEAGAKKSDASNYLNIVNKPLVVGNPDELLMDKIGIPELHVLTALVFLENVWTKLKKIINGTGQSGEQFVKSFLKGENIRRADQRGGKTLEVYSWSKCFSFSQWEIRIPNS